MGTNSEECLIINGYIMSIFLIFTLFFSKLYRNLEIQLNYSLRKIERIERHLKLYRENHRDYKGLPGLEEYLSENELSLGSEDSESEYTESENSDHTVDSDHSDNSEYSENSDDSEYSENSDDSETEESNVSDHSEEVIDHKDVPSDSLKIKDPNNRWYFNNLF